MSIRHRLRRLGTAFMVIVLFWLPQLTMNYRIKLKMSSVLADNSSTVERVERVEKVEKVERVETVVSPPEPQQQDEQKKQDSSLRMEENPPRGAAMMMVSKPWANQRKNRLCYFNKSMDALVKYWLPNNPYPIILQHPKGWTQDEMDGIRSRWPNATLHFTKNDKGFDLEIPEKLERGAVGGWPMGYKKMIAYKTFGFLRSPFVATNELDYLMHIDDDSCLRETVPYDVFRTMRENKVAYAYKQLFRDQAKVVRGLGEFADNYMNSRNLTYANPALESFLSEHNYKMTEPYSFTTNLEWIDLNQYRQPEIMAFLTALEQSQMIFHRRWGDAPLRFLLAYMFWNPHQIMQVCSAYQHNADRVAFLMCKRSALPVIENAVLKQLQRCGGGKRGKCN